MAVSSISCSLKPPAPFKQASSSSARPQSAPATTTTAHWSGGSSLRRACVAAAACAVVGMSDGAGAGMALTRDAVVASRAGGGAVVAVDARGGPARWSDRRQCPPWRANSLENFVPENLPRPSAQRRFNSVTEAPALAPDAVAPFLARRSGGMGCFSL